MTSDDFERQAKPARKMARIQKARGGAAALGMTN
jgi:hypothetical protein